MRERIRFRISSPGCTALKFETQGFKQFIQDNVEVQVDVATRVDAKLQVGNVTESVLVTTEAPPLQTDSASLGTTISQAEVESIPLSGRNVNNMLTLVAGRRALKAAPMATLSRTRRAGRGPMRSGSATTQSVAGSGTRVRSISMALHPMRLQAISIRSFPLRTWCKSSASSPTMSAPSMVATREESLTSPPNREPTSFTVQHTSTCAIRF